MKVWIVIIALTLTAWAQDIRPRLELEPRLNLNGGGYQTVSGSMTGGLGMEDTHFLWHVSGTYDAARKTNDGTLDNPHGNARDLDAEVFGRSSNGWLFGAGGHFSQLRTTNYSKTGWFTEAGFGKDFCPECDYHSFSGRLTFSYRLPVHKVNVEQGFDIHFLVPSPANTSRHIFFDEHVFAGWYKGNHDANMSLGVLFRF